jgi:sulfoxide reductase catalytic subunit YedY
MPIRIQQANLPAPSEITPEPIFFSRRELLSAGLSLPALALPAGIASGAVIVPPAQEDPRTPGWLRARLKDRRELGQSTSESLTPFADVSGYNNFYEFGPGKGDPAKNGVDFVPHPWRVRIDGDVEKPADYLLEDLIKGIPFEDRIYRLRCVEAWSMVIPWVGFPLSVVLKRMNPGSRARFVSFQTLHDPDRMPGQKSGLLRWPYVEGLRIDEAMHPLTLLAVGVYGRSLPAQNGAPLRLVVPWKYGFKSIKSIVRISLTANEPVTTWSKMAPSEYGFYANVNPDVDHPRWSQKRERRLPNSLLSQNWTNTMPFNGYAEQVASLYRGMDLRRQF